MLATIAWMTPTGDGPRNHPLIEHLKLPPMGVDARGYTIATRTLLFHTQGGEGLRGGEAPEPFQGRPLSKPLPRETPKIRALDKQTGAIVWEHEMPLITGSRADDVSLSGSSVRGNCHRWRSERRARRLQPGVDRCPLDSEFVVLRFR